MWPTTAINTVPCVVEVPELVPEVSGTSDCQLLCAWKCRDASCGVDVTFCVWLRFNSKMKRESPHHRPMVARIVFVVFFNRTVPAMSWWQSNKRTLWSERNCTPYHHRLRLRLVRRASRAQENQCHSSSRGRGERAIIRDLTRTPAARRRPRRTPPALKITGITAAKRFPIAS